jgi:hypothetical protein
MVDIERWWQSVTSTVKQLKEVWESGELDYTPAQHRDLLCKEGKALGARAHALQLLPSADRLRLLADHPVFLKHLSEVSAKATTLAAEIQVRHSGGKPNRIVKLAAPPVYGLIVDAQQNPTTTPHGRYVKFTEFLVKEATGLSVNALRACRYYIASVRSQCQGYQPRPTAIVRSD